MRGKLYYTRKHLIWCAKFILLLRTFQSVHRVFQSVHRVFIWVRENVWPSPKNYRVVRANSLPPSISRMLVFPHALPSSSYHRRSPPASPTASSVQPWPFMKGDRWSRTCVSHPPSRLLASKDVATAAHLPIVLIKLRTQLSGSMWVETLTGKTTTTIWASLAIYNSFQARPRQALQRRNDAMIAVDRDRAYRYACHLLSFFYFLTTPLQVMLSRF